MLIKFYARKRINRFKPHDHGIFVRWTDDFKKYKISSRLDRHTYVILTLKRIGSH